MPQSAEQLVALFACERRLIFQICPALNFIVCTALIINLRTGPGHAVLLAIMSAPQDKATPKSSPAKDASSATGSATQTSQPDQNATEVYFPVERTHLIGAAIMFCILFVAVSSAPPIFWLLLLFPLLFGYWVKRSGTTIDNQGLKIHNAFKSNVDISWEEFSGLRFRKARTYAVTNSGKDYALPGITFAQLPQVAAASNGRIPDAITQAHEAEDGNMVIYTQDGNSRMVTKEEYDAEHERLKAEVKAKLAQRDAQNPASDPQDK